MPGDFFAVGANSFHRACDAGINEAAAFLVLARGSGSDNVTSSWSANAVHDYAGMRWTRASEAIRSLEARKLVKRSAKSGLPSYKLERKGDDIWLPNSIVRGVDGQTSPVALLRQTQDPLTLRLFVDLYSAQNLREDGGISARLVSRGYDRHPQQLANSGQFIVWGFNPSHLTVFTGQPAALPHMGEPDDEGHVAGDFFRRLDTLMKLGLVEEVPWMFDGPEGEPIHPVYAASTIEAEALLASAATSAAYACMTEGQIEYWDNNGWPDTFVPVPRHISNVSMVGILRLRHRPHTTLTGGWWAQLQEFSASYIAQYEQFVAKSGRRVA